MPVIDVPGIGPVQADNFATEQTLNRLVDAVNNMSMGPGGVQSIFAAVAGDSKRAARDLKAMGQSASYAKSATDSTTESVVGLGRGSRQVTAAFSSYARSLSSVNIEEPAGKIGEGLKAAGSAISTAGGVFAGALTTMLGGGPGLGAAVGFATAKLTEFAVTGLGVALGDLDKMSSSYRKAANNGALFGQSMLNFRNFAHNSGLTMSQFNNVLEKSREQISAFGGMTTEGANNFALANSRMIREHGDAFQRMGYTFEDMGSATAEYMAAVAEGTPGLYGHAVSMKDVTQGAYNLAVQQKALATINGTTLEQEKEKMRMQRKDAQMNAVLMGMSQKQRDAVQALSAQFPQATQFIKEFVAFGGPVSKEGNLQAAMMSSTTDAIANTLRSIEGGADPQAAIKTLSDLTASSDAIASETRAMADLVKLGVAGSTNSFVQMAEKNFNEQFQLMVKTQNGVIQNVTAEMAPDLKNFKVAIDPAAEAANQMVRAFQTGATSISAIMEALYRSPAGRAVLGTVANTITVPAQGLQGIANAVGPTTAATGTAAPPSNIVSAANAGRLAQTDAGVLSSIAGLVSEEFAKKLEEKFSNIATQLIGMTGVANKQLAATTDLVEEVKKLKDATNRQTDAVKTHH